MPANKSVKRALSMIEKDKSKVLGLTVNNKPVTTGQYFPRAEAQTAPQISFAVPSPSATYLVIALDLDAPFQSWTGLGPILHWVQPGFKVSSGDTLTTDAPFVANFIGPAPPPMSGPHRYTFFLFEQPEGFNGAKFAPAGGKTMGNGSRMWTDMDGWMKKMGLSDPIAVNYFTSN